MILKKTNAAEKHMFDEPGTVLFLMRQGPGEGSFVVKKIPMKSVMNEQNLEMNGAVLVYSSQKAVTNSTKDPQSQMGTFIFFNIKY